MKKLIRETLAFTVLKLFPLSSTKQTNIVSVFFHDPPKELFEHVIGCLHRRGYTFISTEELHNAITQKAILHEKALITLDDGWKGNQDLLPIIEKYNTPITIFTSTNPVREGNFWWEYAAQPGQEKITGLSDIEDFKLLPEHPVYDQLA